MLGFAILLIACISIQGTALVESSTTRSPLRFLSARTRAIQDGCENVVKRSLRDGFNSGSTDMLSIAREMDRQIGSGQNSAERAEFFGIPILCTEDSYARGLSNAGALVFTQWQNSESGPVCNPRDPAFALQLGGPVIETEAVRSILEGRITAAVLKCPSIPLSVGWGGVTAMKLPSTTLVCGSSLADVMHISSSLGLDSYSSTGDWRKLKLPLEGIKIGYSSVNTLEYESQVEPYVSAVVNVAIEVLEGLGATCKRITPAAVESMSFDEDFATIVTPLYSSAACLIQDRELNIVRPRAIATEYLQGRLSLSLPGGVVAGEDDGYDSSLNELHDVEGLPVPIVLTAAARSTASSEITTLIAECFVAATRWSSEVFATGATRESAKEDMDDVRELFGVFFPKTLLRYLGKQR